MASTADSISMALFCDFENVALGVRDANYEKFDIKRVLERLLLKGSIVVKKAYCDWDRYKSFKSAMHEANFELIEIPHVRQSGKNSADIRLVVDALDLCYTKSHVDTFVIISGDSDFSPLVSKLRENAKQVIGVGVKQSTSDLLIANCDEFIFYDDLVRDGQRSARRDTRDAQPSAKRSPEEEKRRREELESRRGQAIEIAVETFDALMSERGDSGKIWASMLKEAIKRRKPDFNESYFGFRAFGNLLEEAQARGLLVVGRDEKSGAYVQRPSAVAQTGTAEEAAPSSGGPALVTDADTELESAAVAEAQGTDVAGKDKPEKTGRSATAGKTGRSRTSTARRAKTVEDTVQADAVPAVATELPVAEPAPASPAEPAQDDGAPAEDEPAARRPAKQGNARGRSGSRGRKAEGRSAEEEVKVGTEAVQPQAALPEPADTPAAAHGHSEADAAPPARKPAARRRTRKPAASETGDEG
jgi:uncharacterized protein (TIGR00288 family)